MTFPRHGQTTTLQAPRRDALFIMTTSSRVVSGVFRVQDVGGIEAAITSSVVQSTMAMPSDLLHPTILLMQDLAAHTAVRRVRGKHELVGCEGNRATLRRKQDARLANGQAACLCDSRYPASTDFAGGGVEGHAEAIGHEDATCSKRIQKPIYAESAAPISSRYQSRPASKSFVRVATRPATSSSGEYPTARTLI